MSENSNIYKAKAESIINDKSLDSATKLLLLTDLAMEANKKGIQFEKSYRDTFLKASKQLV